MALVLAVIDYGGEQEAYLASSEEDAREYVRAEMEESYIYRGLGRHEDMEDMEDAILAERLNVTVTIGGGVTASLNLNMDDLKELFSSRHNNE